MKRGDILVELGTFDIGNVRDLMYALRASKPGEKVKATVIRDDKEVVLDVTFGKSSRGGHHHHHDEK
jgi:S1-C subfamily serine protease